MVWTLVVFQWPEPEPAGARSGQDSGLVRASKLVTAPDQAR